MKKRDVILVVLIGVGVLSAGGWVWACNHGEGMFEKTGFKRFSRWKTKHEPLPTITLGEPDVKVTPTVTVAEVEEGENEDEGDADVSSYPVHVNITAAVFWVGEPIGEGSSEDNAMSAWDDEWMVNFGGYDDPVNRNGYYPVGFMPLENPFYLDLPYNDFTDEGVRKDDAYEVVPWADEKEWSEYESMIKNRWVKLIRNGVTCYGQIEDSGPYEYDDYAYVFGDALPVNQLANNAGLDVSPALRDCLQFEGVNNDLNKVDWQFVEEVEVPDGPWKKMVTSSQVNWI